MVGEQSHMKECVNKFILPSRLTLSNNMVGQQSHITC